MFDAVVSPAHAVRWNGSVALALLSHLVLLLLAIGRTSSQAANVSEVPRDTIRLELARVEPEPLSGSRYPPSKPDEILPVAPPIRPVPIQNMKAPHVNFTFADPGDTSIAAVRRHIGETAAPPDSWGLVATEVEADELPLLIGELRPHYPAGLRRAGVSGSVQVEYLVRGDGRMDPRSVRVLTSTHPGFVLAAVEALRSARFKPARRAGRPIAVLVRQYIRFQSR